VRLTQSNPPFSFPTLLVGVFLAIFVLLGSFCHLADFPALWWDEAIFSETAANLVQHGRYAFTVQSPDQLSDLDFRISVGPAVILPVAMAYRLFGVGVIPGRLVMGLFLCLVFLFLYLGAKRLWGRGTALAAAALALAGTDVLYWGRSVLGDIPALGLFLGGTWLLVKGMEEDKPRFLLGGGVFLGLAFAAKEFYGLAFLPPLGVMACHYWDKKGRLARWGLIYILGLSLPLLAYLGLKWAILGDLPGAVLHFVHQKRLLCHEFFTPLTIGRIYPESVVYLLGHPLIWMGILGSWWVVKKEAYSPGARLWVWSFILWSLVYLTAVWWHRFALPALFLAAPLGVHFLRRGLARLTAPLVYRPLPGWLAGGLILCLILVLPLSGLEYLDMILTCRARADSPYRLVDFLKKKVPRQCLIETPEYELVFLDDYHRIHLMPEFFFVEATPDKVVLLNPRDKPYDFDRVGAEVLILGTFGKSVFRQVYPPERLAKEWRRVAQVDNYDIYVSRKTGKKSLITLTTTRLDIPSHPPYNSPDASLNYQEYH
jgi:hypothetical protein